MKSVSMTSKALLLAATLAVPATGAFAQVNDRPSESVLVQADRLPSRDQMTAGPEVEGIISARAGDRMQVTASDGTRTVVTIDDETEIKSKGGFLGLSSKDRAASSLFNGLPVKVKTMQYANVLVADEIRFSNDDLETAAMIFNGTDQRFAQNEAATEALRGRMGDIDQYNIKSTTNVYFDTGR